MINIDTIALQAATDIMALPQPVDLLGGHVQLKAKIQIIVRNVVEDALDKAFPDSAAVSDCRRYCQREADESAAPIAAQSAVAAASVPIGWKLVPIEPTDEMFISGGELYFDTARQWVKGSTTRDQDAAGFVYRAMLNAAPAAPLHEAGNEAAPERCANPAACEAQGCRNPLGRCEEAAPSIAAPTEVERDALLSIIKKHWHGRYFNGVTHADALEINAAIATGEKHE